MGEEVRRTDLGIAWRKEEVLFVEYTKHWRFVPWSLLCKGELQKFCMCEGENVNFPTRNNPASQISDKPHYLQISDRKGGTKQFSDTHRKGDSLFHLYTMVCLDLCTASDAAFSFPNRKFSVFECLKRQQISPSNSSCKVYLYLSVLISTFLLPPTSLPRSNFNFLPLLLRKKEMGLWLYLCTVVGNLTAKEHLSEFCLRLVWRSSCRKIDYALLWAEDNIVRMHTFFASFWTSPHGVPCHVQVFGERHRPLPGHVLAPDAASPHAHALEVGLREGEVVRIREGGLL